MEICNCIAPVVRKAERSNGLVCRRCNRWYDPENGSKPAVTKDEIQRASATLFKAINKLPPLKISRE